VVVQQWPVRGVSYQTGNREELPCIRQGEPVGPAVGQFVRVLLSGVFPWARLRQAQKLLRLAERYGAARVNAACACQRQW
jgi:hypothetical protein